MSQPRWDFFIAHGDASRDEARALHEAVAHGARVFSRAASLAPGDDVALASRALGDAGVVVLLLARDGDIDRTIGDDLTAAIERLRDDPARCFIPVYLDAEAERRGDAVARARESDLRVVFVGGRTGGRDTLRTLLGEGAVGMKLTRVDPDDIPEDESAALKPLRRSVEAHRSFATEDEAAARTLEHFADWLKDWVTVATGAGAALEAWERAYLLARHTKWKTGSHEGLREASRGKSLDRARLYVPLRAVATETEYVDAEGALAVLDQPPARSRSAKGQHELFEVPMGDERRERGAPWLEALVTHRGLPSVVVEAAAGAGKTVLLQHLACELTSMHLGEPPTCSTGSPRTPGCSASRRFGRRTIAGSSAWCGRGIGASRSSSRRGGWRRGAARWQKRPTVSSKATAPSRSTPRGRTPSPSSSASTATREPSAPAPTPSASPSTASARA